MSSSRRVAPKRPTGNGTTGSQGDAGIAGAQADATGLLSRKDAQQQHGSLAHKAHRAAGGHPHVSASASFGSFVAPGAQLLPASATASVITALPSAFAASSSSSSLVLYSSFGPSLSASSSSSSSLSSALPAVSSSASSAVGSRPYKKRHSAGLGNSVEEDDQFPDDHDGPLSPSSSHGGRSSSSARPSASKRAKGTPSAAVTAGMAKVMFSSPPAPASLAASLSSSAGSAHHQSMYRSSLHSGGSLNNSLSSCSSSSSSSLLNSSSSLNSSAASTALNSSIDSAASVSAAFCTLGVPSPSVEALPSPLMMPPTPNVLTSSPLLEEDERMLSQSDEEDDDEDDDEEDEEDEHEEQKREQPDPNMALQHMVAATSAAAASSSVSLQAHHPSSFSSLHPDEQLQYRQAVSDHERERVRQLELLRASEAAAHAEAQRRALAEEAAEEAQRRAEEEEQFACEEELDEGNIVIPVTSKAAAAAVPASGPSCSPDSAFAASSTSMMAAAAAVEAAVSSALVDPVAYPSSLSSASAAAEVVNAQRFALPPSTYRSYHSRSALIVSVERALEEPDADVEAHMWSSEQRYAPYPFYIAYQPFLEASMRPILLSWMMEVAAEYSLCRETIHLAINFVDRFLSLCPPADFDFGNCNNSGGSGGEQQQQDPDVLAAQQALQARHNSSQSGLSYTSIDRSCLQLLGVTCLFIAAKIEEIHPPSTDDFADTTAEAACASQIFAMERTVLQVLQWRLHSQTPVAWLKTFVKKIAIGVYEEFKTQAAELFHAVETAASAPAAAASSSAASSSSAVPATAEGATPPLSAHVAQQRFSSLQLSFLQTLESLLSADLFVRQMELLDVLALDMHSLRFYPSQLAAAVLYLYHPPASALHHLVLAATGYEYDDLYGAVHMLSLFVDMPFVGQPDAKARVKMLNLNLPFDELWARHVHNEQALEWLRAMQDQFGNCEGAAAAAPAPAQVANATGAGAGAGAGADDGAAAAAAAAPAAGVEPGAPICHINVARALPAFMPRSVLADMAAEQLLRPVRSRAHRDLGVWLDESEEAAAAAAIAAACASDGSAMSRGGSSPLRGEVSMEQLLAAGLIPGSGPSVAAAAAAAAALAAGGALPNTEHLLLAETLPAVAPASESFLAAAAAPYLRLPPDAVHAGQAAKAAKIAKEKAAAAGGGAPVAPSPQMMQHHAGAAAGAASNGVLVRGGVIFNASGGAAAVAARAAAAAAAPSATTVYTFGAGAPAAAAAAAASSSSAPVRSASVPHSQAAADALRAQQYHQQQQLQQQRLVQTNEWESSDEDDEAADAHMQQ